MTPISIVPEEDPEIKAFRGNRSDRNITMGFPGFIHRLGVRFDNYVKIGY